MADQITDNRTLVDSANAVGSYVGSTSPALDTDVKVQGTGSIAEQLTNSRRYVMFDAGATQDWSNNVFYVWLNCGVVGLLDTKANGGMTIRFAGPTDSDFFEFYVGGSDSWPTAVEGGWVQFVVDIEGTPSNTGGTPPATTAIQKVGWSGVTASVMTKVSDNTWLDEIRRLPDGSPGIIVEGRSGGATDWTFADIVTQLGTGAGTLKNGPGGAFVLNTPIQFGINDTTTHGFTDTNQIVLWDDQEFAPTDLYGLSALGNSGGTTNVTLGVKTGTGDDATGAQGVTFAASSTGVRWTMDFDDPDLDGINLYGCTLIHGGDFQLDDVAVSVISSLYIDCSSATVSNSEQLRCKVIDANTADGVAFMTTDDLTDIVFCEFEFSDGHAVELTTPIVASQTSKGNKFTGYGLAGTNDAALYNNAGGAVTVGVTDGGDTPTVRNGASASTTVNNAVTVTVSGVTEGAAVKIVALETVGSVTAGDTLQETLADSAGSTSLSFNFEGDLDVVVRARQQGLPNAAIAEDNAVFTDETTAANSTTTADMTLLPAVPVINQDAYYFGHNEEFGGLVVDLSTAGVGGGTITWQYWNGAWTALSGVTDGTASFSGLGEGKVTWTIPGDWADTTINSQGPFRFVRALFTAGSFSTAPVGRKATLDVTRYLPFNQDRTITSGGLDVVASWNEDTTAQFAPHL